MKPTRPATLLALAVTLLLLGYLLALVAYGSLPKLPAAASVSLAVLAVTEAAMAKVVGDRLGRRTEPGRPPSGRPLHPLQVARAAVLAKASSVLGALVGGAYAGFFGWTFPRRDQTLAYSDDTRVAGVCVLAASALVLAALLLERSCRMPERPDDAHALRSEP